MCVGVIFSFSNLIWLLRFTSLTPCICKLIVGVLWFLFGCTKITLNTANDRKLLLTWPPFSNQPFQSRKVHMLVARGRATVSNHSLPGCDCSITVLLGFDTDFQTYHHFLPQPKIFTCFKCLAWLAPPSCGRNGYYTLRYSPSVSVCISVTHTYTFWIK